MGNFDSLFKKENVSEYDVYSIKATLNEIQLRGFDIETIRDPVINVGYTVRALSRDGILTGIGSASCSQKSRLENCIRNAKFLSTLNLQKIKYEFPAPKPVTRVNIMDKVIKEDPIQAITDCTSYILDQLKGQDRSDKSLKPTFGKIRTYLIETEIENSTGLMEKKAETYFYLELALKASDGVRIAEFWPRKYRRRICDLKIDELMPKWIKLARDALDAKIAPAGDMPVVLNPESLCDAIVPIISYHGAADQKYKNQSLFNKGDKVASEDLEIFDDGILDYGLSSAPFDDEGTPQKRTSIIEKGIFKNFISDQKYALMLNENPTGNGLKPLGMLLNPLNKHLSSIMTSPTNIIIKPGKESFDDIIKEISRGILIEQFSWLYPDPLSSGFSSEIRNGYFIENGEIKQPIKGGMIAGKV